MIHIGFRGKNAEHCVASMSEAPLESHQHSVTARFASETLRHDKEVVLQVQCSSAAVQIGRRLRIPRFFMLSSCKLRNLRHAHPIYIFHSAHWQTIVKKSYYIQHLPFCQLRLHGIFSAIFTVVDIAQCCHPCDARSHCNSRSPVHHQLYCLLHSQSEPHSHH